MKNRILPVVALVALVMTLTSCYSSRKGRTGCPVNVKVVTTPEVKKQVA
jgi:hypothetical protein